MSYRFGTFEFDAGTLELRKSGRVIRVRPQSLKLLALLVERPGELITRDTIQRALWGAETFVDYEQGVNHAIKEVRAALGDASGAPRFIETLPRRGYRFVAPVERIGPAAVPALLETVSAPREIEEAIAAPAEAELVPAISSGGRFWRVRLAIGVAVVLLGAAVAGRHFWRGENAMPSSPAALTVRPFSTSAEDRALGVGLSHAISARLGGQHRMSIRAGDNADGQSSAASLVLEGEIIRSADSISVIPRLVDGSSGRTVWSDRLQVRTDDLFSLENVVAERVIDALNLQLAAAEQDRLRRRYTSNGKAYEEYLRGRAEMIRYTPEGTASAVAAFESALREDQSFALARAGLAMACADMCLRFAATRDVEMWGLRAEAEAQAALALDPHLAEAHLARAATARKREFDWGVVIASSQRALVLNPNLPQAHFFKAAAFYHLGYMEEALLEVQKGRNLRGPDVVEPVRTEGIVALFSGHFAPARAHLEQTSRLSSQPIGDAYLALAAYYSGSAERGRAMLETLATNTSASTAARAGAALAGILAANRTAPAAARQHIDRVVAGNYRDHHVAYSLGVAYAQLGAFDDAQRWLRTAADTGFLCLPWYQRDPLLEPFRRRSEYAVLVAHVRERREVLSTSSSATP